MSHPPTHPPPPSTTDFLAHLNAGLEIDPSNEGLKSSLEEAEQGAARQFQGAGAGGGKPPGLGGLFSSPEVIARLMANPETRVYMGQPDFQAMLQMLNSNPGALNMYLQDPRFAKALEVRPETVFSSLI